REEARSVFPAVFRVFLPKDLREFLCAV
ncbi:MAG: hypothetical protein AVDCRST_MAG80-2579, partial [uncultured Rubrobacteraceae bacterium]